jgi:hypothetical protein
VGSSNPIKGIIGDRFRGCWPCGQESRGEICAAGSHIDVAAKFCAGNKIDTKYVRTKLISPLEHTRLAVKLVELTIDAYEKPAGDVGGNIDAVTLRNDGSITWNSNPDCPESQD